MYRNVEVLGSVRSWLALSTLVLLSGCIAAVGSGPGDSSSRTTPVESSPEATPSPRADARERDDGPGDYAEVIPEGATRASGLFDTHLSEDQLLFEIPTSELNKDMLLVTTTVAQPGTAGTTGGGRNIVRWEKRGDRIHLREISYAQTADPDDDIFNLVARMQEGAILETFDIEAYAPSGAAVIDATGLFTSTQEELGSVQSVDEDASWIDHVAAFPTNVEVEVTQTGRAAASGANATGTEPTTRILHFSMLKLPENPMMPRYHDSRVGFNSTQFLDYSMETYGSDSRRVIHRHRLEKANPNAAMSDPVEPIVYWVDPNTPDWLKPYVVEGVNKWQKAFEAAGFTNAIFGRVAPTPEEDPDFSLGDARHSVIYWRPSETANANGGQVVDPRTGEILHGRVQMFHNVMDLVQDWYFTQVGPLDERAKVHPLPEDLMGDLVAYVVTHEVGHAIGFPHNMKASGMYPADSLRSAEFLSRMGGHVSTLMDYSRFNYVAQPEDNIPVELLIPGVGPYDEFAVKWGYSEIPDARTPEDEIPTLNSWARQQDSIPWFRFTTSGAPNDPNNLTEAVGDGDVVQSSTLGLKNLRRVKDMLLPVAEKPGESYELLEDLYGNMVSQWGRYNGHVATLVGAADTQEKYGTGPRFMPVGEAKQREAVLFLNENVFHVPDWVLDTEILRRIEAEGAVDRVRTQQVRVLNSLLSPARLDRLIEYEALDNSMGNTYSLDELMVDIRDGVWDELDDARVAVDVYRRNLQRAYLETVDGHLNPTGEDAEPLLSDVRPVLRGELAWLHSQVEAALPKAAK